MIIQMNPEVEAEAARRLPELRAAIGAGPLLILTHDNPDPDALASGAALSVLASKAWNIPSRLGFSGLIGRAENKKMHDILTPEWVPLEELDALEAYPAIALVDTQPGAGNNSLPPGLIPQIVIDHHHPIRNGLDEVQFLDIRTEFGATSSMLYLYLKAARVALDPRLTTAVFYAIQTDTQALSRGSSPVDQQIYFELINRIDYDHFIQISQAALPSEYFQDFSDGLKAARVYGKAVFSYLKELHRPDFTAEMADSLIRLEGMQAALCMGTHGQTLFMSLRTISADLDAGMLIQKIIPPNGRAGGHGTMAGGQIRLGDQSADKTAAEVQQRFLAAMGEGGLGKSLLS